MKYLLILFLLFVASCSVIHRAEKLYNKDPVICEDLESWYITIENPENNTPNEQDSIKTLIKNQIRKNK